MKNKKNLVVNIQDELETVAALFGSWSIDLFFAKLNKMFKFIEIYLWKTIQSCYKGIYYSLNPGFAFDQLVKSVIGIINLINYLTDYYFCYWMKKYTGQYRKFRLIYPCLEQSW